MFALWLEQGLSLLGVGCSWMDVLYRPVIAGYVHVDDVKVFVVFRDTAPTHVSL